MTNSKQKYLLKGDISGIQDFIFNVASKKAAKSLKARSFYVQLIGDLAMKFIEKNIEKKLSDYSCEVLYNGGGNFFLNIETDNNFDKVKNQLEKWQKTIDEELLFDEFYVSLSCVEYEYDKGGKIDFGKTWGDISENSNARKLKKFKNNFSLGLFEPYSFENTKDSNNNQRWFNTTSYIYEGIENKRWATVTDNMAKKDYLKTKLFGEIEDKSFNNDFDTIVNKLPIWNTQLKNEKSDLISKIVEQENSRDDDYISPKKGNIIDFTFISEFAKERTGTAKLGILKMDVDDLSKLFRDISEPLQGEKRSKQLKFFFNEYIYEIWDGKFTHFNYKNNNKTPEKIYYKYNIYPVFTGGDDCFFIGAWDAILQFAQNINNDFKKFVAGEITYKIDNENYENEEIKHLNGNYPTLSAGIIIVDEHFPVVQFAELVKEAIDKAKNHKNQNGEIIKNAVAIFDEVFTWNDFNELLEVSNKLTSFIATGKVSKAVLGHIRQSAAGFEKLYVDAKKGNLNFPRVDRLRYNLRNSEDKVEVEVEEFYKNYIFSRYEKALLDAFDKNDGENPMKYPVATRISEFSLRNK